MEEAALCGVAVTGIMLGVPLYHSIGNCRQGRVMSVHLFRWWLVCAVMIALGLVMAILFGCSILLLANLPPPKLSPVSTSCKILSKDVDLRSAKICVVDNYIIVPSRGRDYEGLSKFQCYFDYYWTSVFKVEYRPHASLVAVETAAESPKESLPQDCRPEFGDVWRAIERFQINEVYPCEYNPGNLLSVELTDRLVGNCSSNELLKPNLIFGQFQTLIAHQIMMFLSSSKTGMMFWRTALSVGLGFCYSVIVTAFTKLASFIRFRVFVADELSEVDILYFEAHLQALFLFVASMFSFFWLDADYEQHLDKVIEHFLISMHKVFFLKPR